MEHPTITKIRNTQTQILTLGEQIYYELLPEDFRIEISKQDTEELIKIFGRTAYKISQDQGI